MALDSIQAELVGAFFEESFEGLDRAEAGLLALRDGRRADVIDDIFRAIHSLKGGAGPFGVPQVAELAHELETVLDHLRHEALATTPERLGLLLEAVDELRSELHAARDRREHDATRKRELVKRLQASAEERHTATEAAHGQRWTVHIVPEPHMLTTGNDPVRLIRALSELASESTVRADTSALPSLEQFDPRRCYLSWTVELTSTASEAELRDVFSWVEGDCVVTFTRGVAPASEPAPEAAVSPAPPSPAPSPSAPRAATSVASTEVSSIRVGVDKIDALMNLVGELVITQSMLGEVEHDGPIDPARMQRIREGLSQLARNTRMLQESVMRLRSMPVGMLFNRFPRVVHDLSMQLDKDLVLVTEGAQCELDKTVLEKLSDPMLHLIRNAIDHGVERPDQRVAAGKPAQATLTLSAQHRGSEMLVEVRDDGRGIDLEKVKARALERGLITPETQLSDDEIRMLIFEPGFSTAETITDVSGRGVGMDVVRKNVQALGGSLSVASTSGQGTTITLRLPLSMAIIDGQLVRVGEVTCIVPLLSIVESHYVDRRKISRHLGQHPVYRLRDEVLPVFVLERLLGLGEGGFRSTGLLVVVESEQGRIALLVDELLAQQQVVVKSLEQNYGRVEGLQGATILGDGNVAYILDVAGLARTSRRDAATFELTDTLEAA
ncbi:MAG: chemotaxis protein CheA [Myxococcota bacterium]